MGRHLDSDLPKEKHQEQADVPRDKVQPAHGAVVSTLPRHYLGQKSTATWQRQAHQRGGAPHQNGSFSAGPWGNFAKLAPMLCIPATDEVTIATMDWIVGRN